MRKKKSPFDKLGEHVSRDDDTVKIGKKPKKEAKERAKKAKKKQDRIEAKLDYLIAIYEEE